MTVRNASSGGKAVGDKVKVAVRIRPLNHRENDSKCVTQVLGDTTIQLGHPDAGKPAKMFAFDFCFPPEAEQSMSDSASWSSSSADQQQRVFDTVGMDVVDNAFLGFNTCVFAYGQTGSGKSYTMMGTREEQGLIPRLCTELFQRAARETGDSCKFKLELSFYEVYNERIRDLLGPSRGPGKPLKVREHSLLGPMVEGLSVYAVNSYEQIERLIAAGNSSRATAATLMNETSSRSHSVFTLKLTQIIADADDKTFIGEKVSKISLVDLAGSERVQKTGAVGKRLEEGGNINKSLTALGKVIAALAGTDGPSPAFVPYRDSVLTWLLKENLGGNSRTTMIATVSPSASNYEETLSTLRFADRAKRIQTHAVVNEDPNAKILRELREEVERLRQLNETHALQNEAYQQAMDQIARRHQEDKRKALEQQFEQFTQYIRELTCTQTNPSTPMTPFGPGGGGLTSSSSSSNGFMPTNPALHKGKFLEWAQRREMLFASRLAALRRSIRHASALAAEANALVASAFHSRSRRYARSPLALLHYSVSLHIPAANLRPAKLIGGGNDRSPAEDEAEGSGGGGGGCVCEPVIVCSWRGRGSGRGRGGSGQQWTVEQMECKLAELRASLNINGTLTSSSEDIFPLFGNLLARREKHSLLGVANVYLGHLLAMDQLKVDSQVLVISQHGEICGKLHVRVQRLEIQEDDDDDDEEEEEDEDEIEGGGRDRGPAGRMLGRTMLCRVELQKATSLPPDHSHLVFCQYFFHECAQVVVPSSDNNESAKSHGDNGTVYFNSAHDFEVVCTRPLLDWLEEDALSVELWGHRRISPEEEEEEEGDEADELDEDQDGRMEMNTTRKMLERNQRHQSVCELVDWKKKGLLERWAEVTKRIELWLELLELNQDGEYVPVPVDGGGGMGGIYRLRHGQQRRLRVQLKNDQQPQVAEEGGGQVPRGTLPLRLVDIHSVSIGSVLVREDDVGHQQLDSYQEVDLVHIRDQWGAVLQRRAAYLQSEIQQLASQSVKGPLEEERERSLLLDWVELVEERNAISVPGPGIPGAPESLNNTVAAGMELHCPLLFLQDEQQKQQEVEGVQEPNPNCSPPGSDSLLALERPDDPSLELGIADKEPNENSLACTCPWDSSLHNCTALNRPSQANERIFLIVKVVVAVSHPFPTKLVLRKRICLTIGVTSSAIGATGVAKWPWSRRTSFLSGTGLGLDVVACIPKSSLDFEHRTVLAELAVRHATDQEQEQDGLEQNHLSEYVAKTIHAVEWLIKLDRLRQEEAISRAMARHKRLERPAAMGPGNNELGMKRTISLPTTMANFIQTPTAPMNSSSTFHRMPTMPSSSFCSSTTVTPASPSTSTTVTPSQRRNWRSQSHTDGFANNNGGGGSSPASSGYASMDGADPAPVPSTRRRPNSLSLATTSGHFGGMRKTMSMSFPPSANFDQMNSIVSPCAFRLAGIDEEDMAVTANSNDSPNEEEQYTEASLAKEKEDGQRIGGGAEPTVEQQSQEDKEKVDRPKLSEEECNSSLSNSLKSCTTSATSELELPSDSYPSKSCANCCCAENRLFSANEEDPFEGLLGNQVVGHGQPAQHGQPGRKLLFFHNTTAEMRMKKAMRGEDEREAKDEEENTNWMMRRKTKTQLPKSTKLRGVATDNHGNNRNSKNSRILYSN